MQRINGPDTVPVKPDPIPGEGEPGFFCGGDPKTGKLATALTPDWCNAVQEEILTVITAAGLAPSTDDCGQLLKATKALSVQVVSELGDQDPHLTNKNNPHSVTAAQTGAYSKTEMDGKLAAKAPIVHTHKTSDVAGLDTALASKAPFAHNHKTANVTGLDAALAAKAPGVHAHKTADVTGLDTALASKAPIAHTHKTADVTGLDAALSGKAAVTHNHDATQINSGILPVGRGGTGRTDGKAPALVTARNIAVSGAVTGSANFDGSGNINIATTQAGFSQSLAASGWVKLPNGLILEWGTIKLTTATLTFPLAFPNVCLMAMIQGQDNSGTAVSSYYNYITAKSKASLTVSAYGIVVIWFAIGY